MNVIYVVETSARVEGEALDFVVHLLAETCRILGEEKASNEVRVALLEAGPRCCWSDSSSPVPLDAFSWEGAEAHGCCNLGQALHELDDKLSEHGFLSPSPDNPPVIVFVCDGRSGDDYEEAFTNLSRNEWFRKALRVAYALGADSDLQVLAKLAGSDDSVIPFERRWNHIVFRSAVAHFLYPTPEQSDADTGATESPDGEPLDYDDWPDYSWSDADGLSRTVSFAMRKRGQVVVRDSRVLLAFVLDCMDLESMEVRVLRRYCEDTLLAPFVEALDGLCDIHEAAERARLWLCEECCVDEEMATRVVRGIAQGLGGFLPAERERELYVFYLLDGGALPPYGNRVLRETVYALQRQVQKDRRLRVKVSVLLYHYQALWCTQDGPVPLEAFDCDCLRVFGGEMERNPGLALKALNAKLSRKEFLKDAGDDPEITIIISSNGECSSYHWDEYVEGIQAIRANKWYKRALRCAFVSRRRDVGMLVDLTNGTRLSLPASTACSYLEFSDWLERMRYDPWRGVRDRCLSLSEAVELALWRYGKEALHDPWVLRKSLVDCMELNSNEFAVAWQYATGELLRHFCDAYEGRKSSGKAFRRVAKWLETECYVPHDLAVGVAGGFETGVVNALRTQRWYASRKQRVPRGITALKEFEAPLSSGYNSPVLLVRNDACETMRVRMTVDVTRGRDHHVASGSCYTVIAEGEVGLLCLDSYRLREERTYDVQVSYELEACVWPYESLSGKLQVDVSGGGQGGSVELRNAGADAAFIKCVHLYEVWHEKDKNDPVGTRLQERWQIETLNVDETLASGDTRTLRTESEWCEGHNDAGYREAFPVGWFVA